MAKARPIGTMQNQTHSMAGMSGSMNMPSAPMTSPSVMTGKAPKRSTQPPITGASNPCRTSEPEIAARMLLSVVPIASASGVLSWAKT